MWYVIDDHGMVIDDPQSFFMNATALLISDGVEEWVSAERSIRRFRIQTKSEGVLTLPASELPGRWMRFADEVIPKERTKAEALRTSPPHVMKELAIEYLTKDIVLYEQPSLLRGSKWVLFSDLSPDKRIRLHARLASALMVGVARWERSTPHLQVQTA